MTTNLPTLPSIIVHCDWGTAPSKRWMAKAILANDAYLAYPPQRIGKVETLFEQVRTECEENDVALIGFDFPIGVPSQYALSVEIYDFLSLLPKLGHGQWQRFYEVCRDAKEISIHRPFYPYNFTPKGTKKRQHLIDGLKVSNFDSLLRVCEQATADRSAAGALFWTLGAKAPGRGALAGWRDLIVPAYTKNSINLWPYQGALKSLLQPGSTIIAETYPAEYYKAILGRINGSKNNQSARKEISSEILKWVDKRSEYLALNPKLMSEIKAGFTVGSDDAFDAVIGLFGMIDAIQNWSPALEPADRVIRDIEGWILGQPAR